MRVILIERAATGAKKQGGAAGPAHVYGCSIGLESIKNPCAQIAFTRIRQHDHNGLARIGGLLCQRQSGADRRARRDADEDALGACDLARHGCGVCRLNRADLVIDRAVKCLGDEIRADALDAMRAEGKEAFGGALLISDRADAQKTDVERTFATTDATAKIWTLSERERKIIENLNQQNDESPAVSPQQGFSLL